MNKIKLGIVCMAPLLVSTSLFASGLTCGYLNITLINTTADSCTLQNSQIYGGSLGDSVIPTTLASGEATTAFSLQQGYFGGPNILLEYQCGSNSISFVSEQNFCMFKSGNISGQVESAFNMTAQFSSVEGSYASAFPGQITWTLAPVV